MSEGKRRKMTNEEIKRECFKALGCLYIAVQEDIAKDVNEKVNRYIESQAQTIAELTTKLAYIEEAVKKSGLATLTDRWKELQIKEKNKERFNALVNLIWESRWVSEETDYQNLVGIAAEIRSGNFDGIDAAAKGEKR